MAHHSTGYVTPLALLGRSGLQENDVPQVDVLSIRNYNVPDVLQVRVGREKRGCGFTNVEFIFVIGGRRAHEGSILIHPQEKPFAAVSEEQILARHRDTLRIRNPARQ